MSAGEEVAAVIENLPTRYRKVIAGALVKMWKKARSVERTLCIQKIKRLTCGYDGCDDEECATIRRAAGKLRRSRKS